jgi:ketosteroid isomerase-like protein
MTEAEPSHQAQASERVDQAFEQLAEPFRGELKLHCYRMLGSVHEAEDVVQETYLRAWRGFNGFDGRGSFRAWLYRIATNACLLGGSTASINSALQRARETLAKRYPDGRPPLAPPPNPAQQRLLGRYLQAWEELDLDSFVALLKEDATYTMPPVPQWYAGRQAIRTVFAWGWKAYDGFRLVPTGANRQPAFAAYSRTSGDAPWAAHSIHVLSLEHEMISTLTLFMKPAAPRLFDTFGFPLTLPD